MPVVQRTPALVLRLVDYGEADRIVTLFTRNHGVLGAMARGARSSRRRFAGALEPFAVLDVELTRGRGQLARLVSSRIGQGYLGLLASLDRMRAAGRALDSVRGMLREDHAEPELFDAIVAFLSAVDDADAERAEQLRMSLLVHALGLLGVSPDLRACGICGRVPRPDQAVLLDPARGHLICRACGGARLRLGPRTRALVLALVGTDWLLAANTAWPATQRDELALLLDALLRAHT